MKIFSWNVNGIRGRDQERACYFSRFSRSFGPISSVWQETKARAAGQFEDRFTTRLPREYWNFRREEGLFRARAIFFRKQEPLVRHHQRLFPSSFCENAFHSPMNCSATGAEEGRVMTAEFHKFLFYGRDGLYTPNAKDDLSRLAAAIQALGSGLSSPIASNWRRPSRSFFCGDLNVAHTELDLGQPPRAESRQEGLHG